MKPLVLYEKNNRRLFQELAVFAFKKLRKNFYLLLKSLWNVLYLVLYVLFVPQKLYKIESVEMPPREVNLREEYQRFQVPRGPFC